MDAQTILGLFALAELGVIVALVNRLLEATGHRQIRPLQRVIETVKNAVPGKKAETETVGREPGRMIGKIRIPL